MSTLGDRVKQVRKHFGLSQMSFAKAIERNHSCICRIEAGKTINSKSTLKLISREYGISYQWLLDGTGDMLEPKSTTPALAEPQAPMRSDSIAFPIVINVKISDLPLKELRHLIAELGKDVETSSDE